MPFNGSGTFTSPPSPGGFKPAVAGQLGQPNDWNALLTDIEGALSTVICRDGQSTVVADIPMGGHKFTGMADGTAATDSATVGQVGQTVTFQTGARATGTTIIPFDDTIPQITEGDQYMTLAITPKSATSKLIIEVVAVLASVAAGNNGMGVALFQDATANALAVGYDSVQQNVPVSINLRHVMTSGTTSATTFRIRAGSNVAGTTTFNGSSSTRMFGGVLASSIVIREVAS